MEYGVGLGGLRQGGVVATISFKYSVRDRNGQLVKGKLDGDNREAVATKLRQMGYIVLDLQEDRIGQLNRISFGTTVKAKDLTIFTRQFATMINAGLSLTKCLGILAAQTEKRELREIIAQLSRDVEAGQSLSDAMMMHPKVFPPIFYNMVRAGEVGGVLDSMLLRIADFFEADANLKARIKSAMTYPIVIGVLVVGVLIAMMVFVVPTFQGMFSSAGEELPLPTQIIVGVSEFVRGPGGIVLVVAVIALVLVFRWWKATEKGRYAWHSFLLKVPIASPIIRKTAVARFTRTFSTLVAAGVPILTAMDIVGDTAGNEVVARAVQAARASVKEGDTIARPLGDSPVFPSMVVQMIAVGEETGALDEMLTKVADFYEAEVSAAVESLTSVLEPVIMVVMGAMVGFIVIALYLPMFKAVTLING